MKKITLLLSLMIACLGLQAQSVFINEIHYDNTSGDVNEGIEIAGPAGTDLTGWTVEFYNGSNGSLYATLNLSGTIDDEGSGYGALFFLQSNIQNGAPDGLALIDNSASVVQFLSYEGSFTAAGGTANGVTSTDIGVSEQPAPPIGESLQLIGSGSLYTDFSWTGPVAESPGDINAGQTFMGAVVGNPPSISCPMDIVLDNEAGTCGAIANFLDATAIDIEDGPLPTTQTAGLPNGSVFPVGTNVVEFSVTDSDGNTATCSFNVIVNDVEVPTVTCQDVTVELDASGSYTLTTTEVIASSSDNCAVTGASFGAPLTVSTGQVPFNFNGTGIIETDAVITAAPTTFGEVTVAVEWGGDFGLTTEVLDIFGPDGTSVYLNNASLSDCQIFNDSFTIPAATWNDWVATYGPDLTFTSQPDTDVDNICVNQYYQLDVTVSSAVATLDLSCAELGENNITVYVNDDAGNVGTCVAVVTVEDNIAPEITCLGGVSGASVFINEIHYDNSGADANEAIEVVGPAGTDLSTYEIILYNGSNGTEYNTVALSGTIDDEGAGYGAVNFPISGIQNGAPDGMVLANNGTVIQFLSYEGSFTATDGIANGLTSTDIGVAEDSSTLDTESLQLSGTGTYYPDFTWNAPTTATPGDINTGQTFEAPSSSVFDVVLDANGMATINVADLVASTSDNCGVVSTTVVSGATPTPQNLETTYVGGSGIRSPMFDVNVLSDITIDTFDVNLDDGAIMDIEVWAKTGTHVGFEEDPGAWTLLGTAFGVLSVGDGLPTPLNLDLNYSVAAGETHAFYIASEDKSAGAGFNYTVGTAVGNVFSSDTNLEVLEGVSSIYPFGTTFSPRVFNGTVHYTTAGGGTPVSSFDVDCSDLGESQIEVTATDAAGNTATCTATINVLDETAPILVCQDITLPLDENGMATIEPEDLLAEGPTIYNALVIGSDNGSGTEGTTDFTVDVTEAATLSFDWDYTTTDIPGFDSFGYVINGTYTQLTDPGLGNQSGTASVSVAPGDVFGFRSQTDDNVFGNNETVVSNFAPGFDGQFDPLNWTLNLVNSDGDAFFVIEIPGGPLSYDACGITVLAIDIDEFDCDDIGTPITVTVFASDASGNLAACTAVVTVVDDLAPEITCPADQTVDPGPNNLFYEVPDYWGTGEATATDNCTDPVSIFTQDPAPGDLLPDGTYTVTLTAEDEYGNVGTCTFELIVESQLGTDDNVLANSVALYPNPAVSTVTLSNGKGLQLDTAAIYDIDGKLVRNIDLSSMGTEKSIDVSNLASGVYLVQIQGENGSTVKRLIKK